MKLDIKTTAILHSSNLTATVTILEKVGNNQYIAEYRGVKYTAMFNPFSGMYYVDDIFGLLPTMSEQKWEQAVQEMRYLCESNERELEAYRKLGSVAYLKKLKTQEHMKQKKYQKVRSALLGVFVGSCALYSLWAVIYLIALGL